MNPNNTLIQKNKDIKEERQRQNANPKNKIQVSHEVPVSLLEKSLEFNDYDYCLPHLLDENKEYRDFFYKSRWDLGRYIVMDNSLHELGEAYDYKRLKYWISELEPHEFIVPDVWEDKTHTLVNAKFWSKMDLPLNTTKVAVVQAKSLGEAIECYNTLKTSHQYTKIAFSYGASYYNDLFPHPNPMIGKMMGRILTITTLYKKQVITKCDSVHLLGCSLPQEFSYYSDFPFIDSIDTSNPIIHGLKGIRYSDFGLLYKESDKIDKLIGLNGNWEDVEYNIRKFRSFIN